MPIPPKGKLGQDYSRIQQHLNSSGLSKDNQALFHAIDSLITASKTIQGFIDDKFPQLDGSDSSLFSFVTDVIAELEDRNNSKYSVSLTNKETQSIPDSVKTTVTFDTTIFDDGLMFTDPNNQNIVLNANGQYFITVRCKFA